MFDMGSHLVHESSAASDHGKDLSMRILRAIQRLFGIHDLYRTAQLTADRCAGHVWERIQNRIMGMDINEARGYIRSRATLVVVQKLSEDTSVRLLAERQQQQLKEMTLQAVIERALLQRDASGIEAVVVRRAA
jgi:hypothetical protein